LIQEGLVLLQGKRFSARITYLDRDANDELATVDGSYEQDGSMRLGPIPAALAEPMGIPIDSYLHFAVGTIRLSSDGDVQQATDVDEELRESGAETARMLDPRIYVAEDEVEVVEEGELNRSLARYDLRDMCRRIGMQESDIEWILVATGKQQGETTLTSKMQADGPHFVQLRITDFPLSTIEIIADFEGA
jgi:hypothetical protein